MLNVGGAVLRGGLGNMLSRRAERASHVFIPEDRAGYTSARTSNGLRY